MKFSRQLVLSSLAVFVLSACSGSATQRRQAKDDFAYLETPPLEQWQLPEGATPQFYPNYNILRVSLRVALVSKWISVHLSKFWN